MVLWWWWWFFCKVLSNTGATRTTLSQVCTIASMSFAILGSMRKQMYTRIFFTLILLSAFQSCVSYGNGCNYRLLESTISRKVKGIFDDKKVSKIWVSWLFKLDRKSGSSSFECSLSKKIHVPNGSPCQEHLLQRGLAHKITKVLRKSKGKFAAW